MKKITALIVAVMMLLSLAAIPAFAEVTDADYVQDGWGEKPPRTASASTARPVKRPSLPPLHTRRAATAPRFRSSAKCRLRIISLTTEAQTLFSTFIPLTVK